MDRTPVTSSMLRSAGYDSGNEILEIEFQSGTVYRYHGVPKATYDALMDATSKGTYFNDHIKDVYRYDKE